MSMLRSIQILALIASVFSSADPLAAGTDQAYRLLIQENHEQAITAYEGYLEEHPDDYKALFNLGTAFYRTSRFSSAAECFEKSIPLAIEDLEYQSLAHYNLGCSLFQSAYAQSQLSLKASLEFLQKARVHFENAHELDPDSEKTRLNLDRVRQLIDAFTSIPSPPEESPSTGSKPGNGEQEQESGSAPNDTESPGPQNQQQDSSDSQANGSDSSYSFPDQENQEQGTPHPEMTKEEAQLFLRALEKNEKRLSISKLNNRGAGQDMDEVDNEPNW